MRLMSEMGPSATRASEEEFKALPPPSWLKAMYRQSGTAGGRRPPTRNQLRATARKRMVRGLPLSTAQQEAVADYASGYADGVPYEELKRPVETKVVYREYY